MPHHMREADMGASNAAVHTHDHAVFVYDNPGDLLAPLAQFVGTAARSGDMAVFVHAFRDHDEARAFLSAALPDVVGYEADRALTLANYQEAFERGGKIDYGHVGSVVAMLDEAARQAGRRGVRIFVDASRQYFDAGRVNEWFSFESWLGPRLQAEVGLVCAYRRADIMRPEVLKQVLATHGYRFDTPAKR